jgi:ubiquinone/menaquinone biosynthesis C-methylase UbiE
MDTLQKTYNSFSSGIDDEKLEKLVNISDVIMGPPAAMLLARAGIDASRTEPFRLLDNACATGTVGSRLQQIVNVDVLKKSSILCGDIVEPQLDIVRKRVEKYGWVNTEVATIDAQVGSLRCRDALRKRS